MKVLWLCNVMIPMIANHLNMESTNKEGWISGLADVVLEGRGETGIDLAVAFPGPGEMFTGGSLVRREKISAGQGELTCYGFYEDTSRPDLYDRGLEERLGEIVEDFRPDLVHCFGTEYPHTLAMCRIFPHRDRLLLGIQGLCAVYANAYFADMPEEAVNVATLRDRLRKDDLREQQRKFARRGAMERSAVKLAGNVTGRTEWDRFYATEWNRDVCYYHMNETLRPEFYGYRWNRENCEEHSIFLSQGDYPVKGLHYVLTALPAIREKYPDVKVYVAGQDLTRYGTWKQKLKISGYGRYLRRLIRENSLERQVEFVGRLDAGQMRDRYLKCGLFLCPSSIENSPNSLGEAMLLGMPCVSADVGGIPSIFSDGEDGILYRGFRSAENSFDCREFQEAARMCGTEGSWEFVPERSVGSNRKTVRTCGAEGNQEGQLETISARLADAVMEMWENGAKVEEYCDNARKHAEKTHDRRQNYLKLLEIYSRIIARSQENDGGIS